MKIEEIVHQIPLGRELRAGEDGEAAGLVSGIGDAQAPVFELLVQRNEVERLRADTRIVAGDIGITGTEARLSAEAVEQLGDGLPGGGPEIAAVAVAQVEDAAGLLGGHGVVAVPQDAPLGRRAGDGVAAGAVGHDAAIAAGAEVGRDKHRQRSRTVGSWWLERIDHLKNADALGIWVFGRWLEVGDDHVYAQTGHNRLRIVEPHGPHILVQAGHLDAYSGLDRGKRKNFMAQGRQLLGRRLLDLDGSLVPGETQNAHGIRRKVFPVVVENYGTDALAGSSAQHNQGKLHRAQVYLGHRHTLESGFRGHWWNFPENLHQTVIRSLIQGRQGGVLRVERPSLAFQVVFQITQFVGASTHQNPKLAGGRLSGRRLRIGEGPCIESRQQEYQAEAKS